MLNERVGAWECEVVGGGLASGRMCHFGDGGANSPRESLGVSIEGRGMGRNTTSLQGSKRPSLWSQLQHQPAVGPPCHIAGHVGALSHLSDSALSSVRQKQQWHLHRDVGNTKLKCVKKLLDTWGVLYKWHFYSI